MIIDKLKTRFNQIKAQVDEYTASDIIISDRIKKCQECENLLRLTRNCKICGCFVDLKVKVKNSECPIGKW
jgi:hypothetical protein